MNGLKGYKLDLIPKNLYFYNIIGLNLYFLRFEEEKSWIFIEKTLKTPIFGGFFLGFKCL